MRPIRALSAVCGWLTLSLLGAAPASAAPEAPEAPGAQTAPSAAAIAARDEPPPEPAPRFGTPSALPAYHHSVFSWENAVTAQTLGLGDDPQTNNPTYEMGFLPRLRYYLHDVTGEALSVRAELGLYREFTNSDVTTRRGEWLLADTALALVYGRRVLGPADRDGTFVELRAPTLDLPTSKASWSSGRYFALGTLVGVNHVSPLLRGRVTPALVSSTRLAVAYSHWFARATVPTNDEFDRIRLTTEGASAPADQLAGASLIQHTLTFSGRFRLEVGENWLWTTDAALSPAWKYELQDEVEVCGVVATGCTSVETRADSTRYVVRTQFNTELSYRFWPGFSAEVGYGNVAGQLGPDGRRRSFFHSPDARLYLSLSFTPHELATPPRRAAQASPGFVRF